MWGVYEGPGDGDLLVVHESRDAAIRFRDELADDSYRRGQVAVYVVREVEYEGKGRFSVKVPPLQVVA